MAGASKNEKVIGDNMEEENFSGGQADVLVEKAEKTKEQLALEKEQIALEKAANILGITTRATSASIEVAYNKKLLECQDGSGNRPNDAVAPLAELNWARLVMQRAIDPNFGKRVRVPGPGRALSPLDGERYRDGITKRAEESRQRALASQGHELDDSDSAKTGIQGVRDPVRPAGGTYFS